MADRSGNNKKKVNQGATLKKVFERLGKYRIFLIFSILLATVSVALTLYIPKLTGHAVDFIVSRGNVDFPGIACDGSDRDLYACNGTGTVADECV